MDNVTEKFNKAMADFDPLVRRAGRIVVAFSGGADSRALLSLLRDRLTDEIVAVHVNHMIRGEEADLDERNCVEWARELNVPIRVFSVDVPALAKRDGIGTEECARRERYRIFDAVAAELGEGTLVATAHNADDNLETVIFNMLRGTGTRGMSGIPPVRDGRYIRPLIFCTSGEIREYCASRGLDYNVDKTNSDLNYSRNYIRKMIVPALKSNGADVYSSVARMCANLREDDDFIRSEAESFLISGTPTRERLSSLHDALLTRVLRLMYLKAGGDRPLSRVNVRDVIGIIRGGANGEISLPGGLCAFAENDAFYFGVKKTDEQISEERILPLDGEPFFFGDSAAAFLSEPTAKIEQNEIIYNLSIHKATDFDKIKGNVYVRRRLPGDRYRYGGMTRKVKKIMAEKRIPASERGSVFVFCDDCGILWIPGFPLRDGVCGNKDAKPVYLCLFEKDPG